MAQMVSEANSIETISKDVPKIGIVGEIYVKYNKFGHRFISDKLVEEGVEVVFPPILEFFTQEIVNVKKNWEMNLSHRKFSVWVLLEFFKHYINSAIAKSQKILSKSKYPFVFENIKHIAEEKNVFTSLMQYLDQQKEKPGITSTISDMKQIEEAYAKFAYEEVEASNTASDDEDAPIKVGGNKKIKITEENFNTLKSAISQVRQQLCDNK